MTNSEIARALFDLADALELTGRPDARYRVRALRTGAQAIERLGESAVELAARGELTRVAGIGEGIARRVAELAERGTMAELQELRGSANPGLVAMARLDGVGPKTAKLLVEKLGISSVEELEAAARRGGLRGLRGFGERKEAKILEAIERSRTQIARVRLERAVKEATPLLERLRELPGVSRAELAGSIRRRKSTVADADILVATVDAAAVAELVASSAAVASVIARGPTKTSVRTRSGLQIDVRAVAPESWGAALHYFTGSKEHNVQIRARGAARGLLINEYGVYEDRHGERRMGGSEEIDVFAAVGLPWIPPELREGIGEIDLAAAGRLPVLLSASDLRGDLHMHTTETDGRDTLEDMVTAAGRLGREYIAITDHSQHLKFVNGLDAARLAAQGREIRALNERLGGRPLVLRGIEADILLDGSIDLGAEVLTGLDWVIGSIHSHFHLPRAEQTRRLIAAIESGLIDAVGHPTGRKIEDRPPYDLDLEAVIDAAARTGVALELNSYPDRLDLDDLSCRLARERGAWIVIDTDSHATSHLYGLVHGVDVARRAGLETSHVLNCLPAHKLLDHLRSRRHSRV